MSQVRARSPSPYRTGRVLACLALLPWAGAQAQDFDREVAFLTVPTGARVVGMGRAGTSLLGHLQSVRWNPAAAATLSAVVPLVSSYDGPLEFRVSRLAVAVPVSGVGVFALSAEAQSFGEITVAGPAGPDDIVGSLSPSNLIVGLSFARQVVQRASIGATAKLVRHELAGDLRGNTVAFDVGLAWTPFAEIPIDLGASLLNTGPGLRLGSRPGAERDPLPTRLRLGASYDILAHLRSQGAIGLRLAVDIERAARSLRAGSEFFGLELAVADVLYVRAGRIAETLLETNVGTTVGLGLRFGSFRLDLARELGVNQLGDESQLSIGASL